MQQIDLFKLDCEGSEGRQVVEAGGRAEGVHGGRDLQGEQQHIPLGVLVGIRDGRAVVDPGYDHRHRPCPRALGALGDLLGSVAVLAAHPACHRRLGILIKQSVEASASAGAGELKGHGAARVLLSGA